METRVLQVFDVVNHLVKKFPEVGTACISNNGQWKTVNLMFLSLLNWKKSFATNEILLPADRCGSSSHVLLL